MAEAQLKLNQPVRFREHSILCPPNWRGKVGIITKVNGKRVNVDFDGDNRVKNAPMTAFEPVTMH